MYVWYAEKQMVKIQVKLKWDDMLLQPAKWAQRPGWRGKKKTTEHEVIYKLYLQSMYP